MPEKNIRIILVDDEKDFNHTMSFWLRSQGYEVVSFLTGEEALEFLKNESADLVLLDTRMPAMSGIEVLENLRQFNKDIPVVFISAYVDKNRVEEAKSYGISGVFFKGDDFSNIHKIIKDILEKERPWFLRLRDLLRNLSKIIKGKG